MKIDPQISQIFFTQWVQDAIRENQPGPKGHPPLGPAASAVYFQNNHHARASTDKGRK